MAQDQNNSFDFSSIEIEQRDKFELSQPSLLLDDDRTPRDQQTSSNIKKNSLALNYPTNATELENTPHIDPVIPKQIAAVSPDPCCSGSFMRDLQRFQQSLSFQSKIYDIYDPELSDDVSQQSTLKNHNNQPSSLRTDVKDTIQSTDDKGIGIRHFKSECSILIDGLMKGMCQKQNETDLMAYIIDFQSTLKTDKKTSPYPAEKHLSKYFSEMPSYLSPNIRSERSRHKDKLVRSSSNKKNISSASNPNLLSHILNNNSQTSGSSYHEKLAVKKKASETRSPQANKLKPVIACPPPIKILSRKQFASQSPSNLKMELNKDRTPRLLHHYELPIHSKAGKCTTFPESRSQYFGAGVYECTTTREPIIPSLLSPRSSKDSKNMFKKVCISQHHSGRDYDKLAKKSSNNKMGSQTVRNMDERGHLLNSPKPSLNQKLRVASTNSNRLSGGGTSKIKSPGVTVKSGKKQQCFKF